MRSLCLFTATIRVAALRALHLFSGFPWLANQESETGFQNIKQLLPEFCMKLTLFG
jgi:hypothetical protein